MILTEITPVIRGSEENNQTILGPPGKCELNTPTALLVTRVKQSYIAALTNVKYRSYNRLNFLYKRMHMVSTIIERNT